jgi:hypothetical protein
MDDLKILRDSGLLDFPWWVPSHPPPMRLDPGPAMALGSFLLAPAT